jgi:hypothetical protein
VGLGLGPRSSLGRQPKLSLAFLGARLLTVTPLRPPPSPGKVRGKVRPQIAPEPSF